ncbi:MAG: hypothetical protein JW731_01035, partial [Bacteroidales bacterium]|nr:hypothetical protein [Bacteroidales bacterium]
MNRILILCIASLIISFIAYSQKSDNHLFGQREKSILCKSNPDFSLQNSLVQLELYCDAYGGLDNYEYIDGVEFGEISNLNSGINFYGDFTNLSTTVTPGVSYVLKIYTGNPYTYDDYGVWIDWNADNIFDPENEQVVCEINNGQPVHTWEIQVPLDVSPNIVIMRIRLKYIDSDCGDPCGSASYGEVEDYTIVIGDADKTSDRENKAILTKQKSDYCEANGGLNNYEHIDGILFGDIVNLESGINFYGDFTGMSTTVQPGLNYPIQIIVENFKNFTDYGIWIDWNLDYNFSEEEQVVCVIDEGSPNSIFYIEVPEDSPNIETRMRIRLKSIGSSCGNPCGASNYGEVEDYSVIVGTGAEICMPGYMNGCTMGDGITNFTLEEIINLNSGCEDNMGSVGWSQYLDLGPVVLEKGDTYEIIISSGSGDNYVSLWIDWNDDLILTPDEIVISNFWIEYPDQLYSVDLEIPDFAPSGQHLLRIRTNTGSFCNDPCIVYDYGEAEDYLVEIIDGTGAECQFFDDFESYQVGEQLVIQNPNDWTTWPNIPGSDKDPYIVDNGGNVVEITGANDLIHVIDNYTSGVYSISFDIYIPVGADGYFNTFQEFAGSSSQWGMQVFFGFNGVGVGSIDGGAQNAANFNFEYNTWQMVKILVDLDNDWAEFFFDGVLVHEWVWSTGAFGTNNLKQLGGSNFYAWPDGVYGNPLYHFDNYCIEDVLIPTSPTNLSFAITGSDVLLYWDYDPGYWIYWDQQLNSGDGIGLYYGGTFYVASHWYPEDLEPYNGMYVTKMNYYHYENAPNASFVLKVWTGPDAENEILSQPIESQIGWNEIDLINPVFIYASQDYWFGYEVTHPEGEDPAGID